MKQLQDNLVWLAVVAITIGAITVATNHSGNKNTTGGWRDADPTTIQARSAELDQQLRLRQLRMQQTANNG